MPHTRRSGSEPHQNLKECLRKLLPQHLSRKPGNYLVSTEVRDAFVTFSDEWCFQIQMEEYALVVYMFCHPLSSSYLSLPSYLPIFPPPPLPPSPSPSYYPYQSCFTSPTLSLIFFLFIVLSLSPSLNIQYINKYIFHEYRYGYIY